MDGQLWRCCSSSCYSLVAAVWYVCTLFWCAGASSKGTESYFPGNVTSPPPTCRPCWRSSTKRVYTSFWNVGGGGGPDVVFSRFMHAVNLIDSDDQLQGDLVYLANVPVAITGPKERILSLDPASPMAGVEDSTTYLLELMGRRLSIIRYKILYEYQRKNGSLTYWLFDKKPLLTMAELMRRVPDEEREAFVKACRAFSEAEQARFPQLVRKETSPDALVSARD